MTFAIIGAPILHPQTTRDHFRQEAEVLLLPCWAVPFKALRQVTPKKQLIELLLHRSGASLKILVLMAVAQVEAQKGQRRVPLQKSR